MTIDLATAVQPPAIDDMLEVFPSSVARSLERRAAWRKRFARASSSLDFIVTDLGRWAPGSTVTVAFLDGTTELHRQVERASMQVSDACNLTLDFGYDASTDRYRSWTERDTDYAADIRISFDQAGLWSHVGMDSVDPTLGELDGLVGGRPHQRSMNLGGFHRRLPLRWQRSVRHEFMHAVAFRHQHQHLHGASQSEFRWEDDDGYVRTRERGGFVPDARGRRPGIYTYLSGAPNNWTREMTNSNLRTTHRWETASDTFDDASIMLYRFPALFYRSNPSPCAPTGDGLDLSDGDKQGLAALYPHDENQIGPLMARAAAARQSLETLVPKASRPGIAAPGGGITDADRWAAGATAVLDRFLKGHNQ